MAKKNYSTPSELGPQVVAIIQQIPPRVTAAFSAISHLHSYRIMSAKFDGGPIELRDFSQKEIALWNASLDTLRLYISGESNAADITPVNEQNQPPMMVFQTPDGQSFNVRSKGFMPPPPPSIG